MKKYCFTVKGTYKDIDAFVRKYSGTENGIFQQCYGEQIVATDSPYSPDTMYRAYMNLRERKNVDLDALLRKYKIRVVEKEEVQMFNMLNGGA